MKNLKITSKNNYPMSRRLLTLAVFITTSSLIFAQTDSLNLFLQKGLLEKQNGRRLESLKNFEKAMKYDANNKTVLAELGSAYLDLRKYYQAKETFKKLVDLGETSAANYKQLLQLSFNLKAYDDAITYAQALKKADPSEKINYYIGKIHYDRDNYGDAIKFLNAAAKEEPKNGEIPYMIGHSYTDMQNYIKPCTSFLT